MKIRVVANRIKVFSGKKHETPKLINDTTEFADISISDSGRFSLYNNNENGEGLNYTLKCKLKSQQGNALIIIESLKNIEKIEK